MRCKPLLCLPGQGSRQAPLPSCPCQGRGKENLLSPAPTLHEQSFSWLWLGWGHLVGTPKASGCCCCLGEGHLLPAAVLLRAHPVCLSPIPPDFCRAVTAVGTRKLRSPDRKRLKSLNNTRALVARSTVDSHMLSHQLGGRTSLQPCPGAPPEKGNAKAQRSTLKHEGTWEGSTASSSYVW